MTDFVFVHGGGQGGWVWGETIAALQSVGAPRTLALDVPGCGAKRGRETDILGFPALIAELVAEVEAAGFRDVVLVGHSQAGTVLPMMAALRPGLFRRLVYLACTAPDDCLTIMEMTQDRVHGKAQGHSGQGEGGRAFLDPALPMTERYRLMFCNDMDESQADTFLARLGSDQWPRCSYEWREWQYDHLAEMPTTYVVCLRDAVLPPHWQDHYARAVHADRIVPFDAGHQAMNTRPQAFAELLLAEAAG